MIGKKLGNRYELLQKIGGGGMAVVYKGLDHALNRVVAVKVLREQYTNDDDFVQRFQREAQAAASLSHPNIVPIHDVGIDDQRHYIVMEYIAGTTLKEAIVRRAPFDMEEAVNVTNAICEALEHAHHNNIIHRDIKPHNILLGDHGMVKVTDFGIARAATSSTITQTGSVMGSVHYFSPEQAKGSATGEKSDIYSLGIVLYEMVTGTLPFSGESPISIALKHVQDELPRPKKFNPSIPQSVENIIMRAVAKEPVERYRSASELIADLHSCLDQERLNEKPFTSNVNDEETKQFPAIHSSNVATDQHGMSQQNSTGHVTSSNTNTAIEFESSTISDETKPFWKKVMIRLLLVGAVLLLLGFVTVQGVKFVGNLLYVEEVEIEDVINVPFEEAIQILEEDQNLKVRPHETHDDEIEEGHVVSQNPVAGTTVKVETPVDIYVSLGKPTIEMPDVERQSKEMAERILRLNDFEEITFRHEYSDDVETGNVIRQIPEADEEIVPDETVVQLIISDGREPFEMPDLSERSQSEAERELNALGLTAINVNTDYSTYPEGVVFDQQPVPGENVTEGESVQLWVSEGYESMTKDVPITVEYDAPEVENNAPGRGNSRENRNNNNNDNNNNGNGILDLLFTPEAEVQIIVSDLDGRNRRVVNDTIQETTTFTVTVRVNYAEPATITVYKDDEEYKELEVDVDFEE